MTNKACESKILSIMRSSMYPCPGNWIAIGRAVVYCARAAQAFRVAIKCRHWTSKTTTTLSCPVFCSIPIPAAQI